MKFYLRAENIILLTLILSIVGCGALLPKPKFDLNDVNSSVVFGYIDTKDMPSDLDWVKIQGLGDENDYVTATVNPKNGAFWHIAVRPGFRQITKFGGTASSNLFGHATKANIYNFGTNDNRGITINIKAPGVYFMGSHKFILHKNGVDAKDQFETQPIKSPSEKVVLQMVLKAMEERGYQQQYSRQFNMTKKRIAELP